MSAPRRIFVSHASTDEPLVDKLVDLLQTGCNVTTGNALCTTLKGMGVEIGTESYIRCLKEELCNATLVVLVLTPNYLASHFCLCELGGAWALELPIVPLVVPPLKKADVKVTLSVTQSGMINDEAALDELRDRIKELIGTGAPTPRWNSKRDQFLDAVPDVLKLLPLPDTVPVAKLKALESTYEVARQELLEKNEQIDTLNAQIKDLEACKDAKQVKAVARKYSSLETEFEGLCNKAASALGHLKAATRSALYRQFRNEYYVPDGNDEWKEAGEAEAVTEIVIHGSEGCQPNTSHPRVRRAEEALQELERVVRNAQIDSAFCSAFEEEHDFPLDFTSRELWGKFLAHV
jgi:hypothetical protein